MALSTLLTADGQFVSQALKHLLIEINPRWQVTKRWDSPQELWQELRPYVIDADGRLVQRVEEALDRDFPNAELGGAFMAVRALRVAATRWMADQLKV
jgi:hypothetical protein